MPEPDVDKFDWRGEPAGSPAQNAVNGILNQCHTLGGVLVVAFVSPIGGGGNGTAYGPPAAGGPVARQQAWDLVVKLSAAREQAATQAQAQAAMAAMIQAQSPAAEPVAEKVVKA